MPIGNVQGSPGKGGTTPPPPSPAPKPQRPLTEKEKQEIEEALGWINEAQELERHRNLSEAQRRFRDALNHLPDSVKRKLPQSIVEKIKHEPKGPEDISELLNSFNSLFNPNTIQLLNGLSKGGQLP
jgi:superfamily I DNA/RNA helicase